MSNQQLTVLMCRAGRATPKKPRTVIAPAPVYTPIAMMMVMTLFAVGDAVYK